MTIREAIRDLSRTSLANPEWRQDANLTPRTGQFLMMRRSAAEGFAARTRSTYCWVCRIKGFHRKHRVGRYDEFSVCRVIGASNLVLPA